MSRASLIVTLALLCAACGGPGLPPGTTGPGLFVTGTFPADTIDARSVAELEVIASDATGAPAPGVTVTFTPDNMFMAGTLDQEPWIGETSRVTGSDGKASIRFKRGDHTPTGRIILSMANTTGEPFADTVTFQILPGHQVSGHTASPRDTTLYLGRSFQFISGGVDRNGDAVPIATTYIRSLGLQVSDAGIVTTTDYGRHFVVATSTAGTDTAWVDVMPQGTLIGLYRPGSFPPGPSLQIVELDGTNRRPAPWPNPDGALWTPDGQHFLAYEYNAILSIQIVDLLGNAHHFGPDSLDHASAPSFSGDKSKVFFGRYKDPSYTLFRANSDGSNVIKALPFTMGNATASFDGSLVASISDYDTLRAYSVPDGVPQAWTLYATQALWSPDGKWIAVYLDREHVGAVVDAVTGQTVFQFGDVGPRAWSPDSQWLVTDNTLVRVAYGLIMPFPNWALSFTFDSWK